MPQQHAKLLYVKTVEELLGKQDGGKGGVIGPVISRPADEAMDNDADVPVCLAYY